MVGNVFIAGTYSLICVPNQLVNGGVTALGMVVSKISGFDIAFCVNLFTLLLLVVCGIFLGKAYLLSSIFSSVCYLAVFSIGTYLPIEFLLHDFLSVPLAALLVGIGYSICIRAKSTTVGFDTIAIILHKKNNKIKIAHTMFLIQCIVLLTGSLAYGWIAVMKGILFTLIQAGTLNGLLSYTASRKPQSG